MTPFDHLKNLHTKKRNWNNFNDEEKKNFNIYIINKGKKEKENKDKIEYLATHFECSKKEAKDYLSLLDKKTINNIIKNYKQ